MGGHVQLGITGGEHGRRVPGEVQPAELDAVGHDQAALGADLGHGHLHLGRLGAGLEAAEVLLHQGLGLFGVEVAGQHQRRVVGPVVGARKGLHVGEADALDVGMRADDRRAVGVALGVERLVQRLLDDAIGPVLEALAALVAHHVLLVGQRHRIDLVDHPAQHVRLQPQAQCQLVGRQREEVVGAVEVGGAVAVGAAGGVDEFVELAARHMPAAGKHQVLEQMGKAGLALGLVARAGMHPQVEGHQRQAVVLDQDELEAVGQGQLLVTHAELAGFDTDRALGGRRAGGQRGGERAGQGQQCHETAGGGCIHAG
mmetsp:Transcript_71465/g.168405  ORF Transcript_71465/g.168405 Transcript_71465/m.168405 type:complete len:314 (+) Transcript_71465:1147-2088(+)